MFHFHGECLECLSVAQSHLLDVSGWGTEAAGPLGAGEWDFVGQPACVAQPWSVCVQLLKIGAWKPTVSLWFCPILNII